MSHSSKMRTIHTLGCSLRALHDLLHSSEEVSVEFYLSLHDLFGVMACLQKELDERILVLEQDRDEEGITNGYRLLVDRPSDLGGTSSSSRLLERWVADTAIDRKPL